jgi:hypothetical protein
MGDQPQGKGPLSLWLSWLWLEKGVSYVVVGISGPFPAFAPRGETPPPPPWDGWPSEVGAQMSIERENN